MRTRSGSSGRAAQARASVRPRGLLIPGLGLVSAARGSTARALLRRLQKAPREFPSHVARDHAHPSLAPRALDPRHTASRPASRHIAPGGKSGGAPRVHTPMGKEKKEKKDKTPSKAKEDSDGGDGELRPVCAIAKPLADIGFHKKILKVVKKGAAPPVPGRKNASVAGRNRSSIPRRRFPPPPRHRPDDPAPPP